MGKIQKQEPLQQNFPADWYLSIDSRKLFSGELGRYFGSLDMIPNGSRFVTNDLRFIVTKSDEGVMRVFRNVCPHGGYVLMKKEGIYVGSKPILCDFHHLSFSGEGKNLGCPGFVKDICINLWSESFTVWNNMILGFNEEEFSFVMDEFGKSLGFDCEALDLNNYQFLEKELDEVQYPLALFILNYRDLLHVQHIHPNTFGMVADTSLCKWEISDHTYPVAYCIQMVMKKTNYRKTFDAKVSAGQDPRDFGWANLLVTLEDNLPSDFKYPLDPNIFALWIDICGSSGLMLEVYCGGLFMAVSHVYNDNPENPEIGNKNQIEFFAHKSLPLEIADLLIKLFRTAYTQSADEDSEICENEYRNHLRHHGVMRFKFSSSTHETGERSYVEWCKNYFPKK